MVSGCFYGLNPGKFRFESAKLCKSCDESGEKMTHRKSVIWRVSRLYPPNFTGAGIQAHREDREFVKLGFSVCVLAAAISAAKSRRCKAADLNGIAVKYLPVVSHPIWLNVIRSRVVYKIAYLIFGFFSSFCFALACIGILLRSSHRGDILIFETVDPLAILILGVARLKQLRTIVRMSLMGDDDPYSRLLRAKRGQIWEYLKLLFFRNVDSVVAISTAMVESCNHAGLTNTKVVTIPYGVDTRAYKEIDRFSKAGIRRELGLHQDKQYVVFVGSAIERKGIDVMIDSFLRLRESMRNVELLIIGPNEFDPRRHYNGQILQEAVKRCKTKIDDAGLDRSVHWIGQVDNVHDYMSAADVFCLPTRREGLPIVVIEAMACGLPVVVACLDGVTTDLITSGEDGTIVHGYDASDYARSIKNILTHPDQAIHMGQRARQRVLLELDLHFIVKKWADLFYLLAPTGGSESSTSPSLS